MGVKNIFAYTEVKNPLPPYISINENDSKEITLTARDAFDKTIGIKLNREILEDLYSKLHTYLEK